MLAIRLARIGRKNLPSYRIIISEKTKDTFGTYLEAVGRYNPRTKECEVNKERILHWLARGAQASATVHNLLVDQHVIEAKKVKASKGKKKAAEPVAQAAAPAPQAAPEKK
jgi:small subunit ribosomal protein S16